MDVRRVVVVVEMRMKVKAGSSVSFGRLFCLPEDELMRWLVVMR